LCSTLSNTHHTHHTEWEEGERERGDMKERGRERKGESEKRTPTTSTFPSRVGF